MSQESIIDERDLARTYDGGDYQDAWQTVKQYRRAVAYHRDRPDAGLAEIMRVSGADRVAVESWISDGGTPAVVQGINTAHERRWLNIDADGLTPLNILVAQVYSSGTIAARNWQPMFSVADPDDSMVATALELMGVGWNADPDAGDGDRVQLTPAADGAVLGRVLAALGAPVGSKADADDVSLPDYLEAAPDSVRKQFARIYLENRAKPASSGTLWIREDRPREYQESLATLIESVAGHDAWVVDSGVMIDDAAARTLGLSAVA